ncbi:MAG: stage II sporulation protein M [Reichenbachiella sp.]|uniref:stage II sporulation protein M n=1 Tax=Reichenbachiella sp. TaxID=2184521 RepID=UPI003267CC4D
MREGQFINQNKDKWIKFEQLLKLDIKDADNLSESFIQITDDLSYSKTFFNNRYIRVYLNNLCQQLFFSIYKIRKKSRKKSLFHFWKEELPIISYQCRRELLIAFSVFILSMLIGVISSINDAEFNELILGPDYIAMSLENIEKGDPMGVYKSSGEMDMFLGITFNNVMVAFRTFLMGIFFALGALGILIYNGIMVGTFQYFFIERDLFFESFFAIWLHGTLEISSIIIAGASGIVLGKGLISPGTHSRLQSFQLSAKRGVKLLMGIIPILVFAALIESFLTRYTEVPDWCRGLLILTSLIFMVFYFVWYPRHKARNQTIKSNERDELQESRQFSIQYKGLVKSANDLMKDTFVFYRMYGNRIMRLNFLGSLCYLPIVIFILFPFLSIGEFSYADWYLEKLSNFVNYKDSPVLYIFNTLFFTTYFTLLLRPIRKEAEKGDLTDKGLIYDMFNVFIVVLIWQGLLLLPAGWSALSFILLTPLIIIWIFAILIKEDNFLAAAQRTSALIRNNLGYIYAVYGIIFLVGTIGLVFLNSPFPVFYVDFVTWNIPVEENALNNTLILANSFISIFSILIICPIFMIGLSLCYFSLEEILEAKGLKEKLVIFG